MTTTPDPNQTSMFDLSAAMFDRDNETTKEPTGQPPTVKADDVEELFGALVPCREVYEPESLQQLAQHLPYQIALENTAVLLELRAGYFIVGMCAPSNFTHVRNVARAISVNSNNVKPRLLTEQRFRILLDAAYQHNIHTSSVPDPEPAHIDDIEDSTAPQKTINWHEFAQSDAARNSSQVADRDLVIGQGTGLRADAERIILDAIRHRASDMHIVPWRDYGYITYRTDGRKWKRFPRIPSQTMDNLANALADMAGIDGYKLNHQDLESEISIVVGNKSGRRERMTLRFQGGPVLFGRCIVIRIQRAVFRNFQQIGIEPNQVDEIQQALYQHSGVLLVTGATGSGKSNTLEAMLRKVEQLNNYEANLIQVGNPVEFPNPERIQKKITDEGGWERSLKAALRSDPDIFSPGEFRDAAEAKIVFDAAATGHLTLTTVHTNNVATTFSRLDSLQIDRDRQATLIELIVSQRLVKVLCEHCKIEDPRSHQIADQLIEVVFPHRHDLKEAVSSAEGNSPFFTKKGCQECNFSGIKGRTCIAEVLTITPEIRRMLRQGVDGAEIVQYAVQHYGMMTLAEAAARKLCRGIIHYDEIRDLLKSTQAAAPETQTTPWETSAPETESEPDSGNEPENVVEGDFIDVEEFEVQQQAA